MKSVNILRLTLLALVLASAVPLWAQQKPLTQEQVRGLVRNQLGDETGARAIRERGINFVPTGDFLDALKNAGAREVFIKALQEAKASPPMPPPAIAANLPLDEFQVFDLLISNVAPARIALIIRQRGIRFPPDALLLDDFQALGAQQRVLSALRAAKVYPADPDALKRHALLVEDD
jgi:hypothetical protein